jgi:type IV pilus assembly protein PilN
MRMPINLASEPFRRDRPIVVASVICGLALTATLVLLVLLIIAERSRQKDSRFTVNRLEKQLQTLNAEQQKIDQLLRRPENAEVFERSLLLNTLLERKGISWTRLFSDLEKVMPYNVRLVTVRLPQITSHNEVMLDMTVGARDAEPVIELLKKLAESPLFGAANVSTSQPPSQNEPLWRYRIVVSYAQKL